MTPEERGLEIKRRREAHGIRFLSEFAERTGVSREAVTKAEKGRASKGIYDRLESWLDRFDEEVGADRPQVEQLEFVIEGESVTVTVKGPVTDREALKRDVADIIRSIRGDS